MNMNLNLKTVPGFKYAILSRPLFLTNSHQKNIWIICQVFFTFSIANLTI